MQFLSTTQAQQSTFLSTQSILLDESYPAKPENQHKFNKFVVK